MKKGDLPLRAELNGDVVIIRIGKDCLAFAFEHGVENNPWDEKSGEYIQTFKVVDKREFAVDVVRELNREEEDGSTPLTKLLDKMFLEAVEQGSCAVAESGENIYATKGRDTNAI